MDRAVEMMKCVRGRRSVRAFDGKPLTPAELEDILRYARAVKTPYDLPIEWRVLSAGEHGLSSPVITGTDTWIAGTMDRPAFERAMALEVGEVMPCVSPLGRPAAKMSLRETLMRKGIRADSRLAFSELFFDGGFDRPLTGASAGSLSEPLEMVRWAPSAVNKQPWRIILAGDAAHFYEKRSRGYVSADGWDLQKIDIGIAMCHFAGGLEAQNRSYTFSVEDPGLSHPEDTFYIATCRFASSHTKQ